MPRQEWSGSHSRLSIGDWESSMTGVIHAYGNGIKFVRCSKLHSCECARALCRFSTTFVAQQQYLSMVRKPFQTTIVPCIVNLDGS